MKPVDNISPDLTDQEKKFLTLLAKIFVTSLIRDYNNNRYKN